MKFTFDGKGVNDASDQYCRRLATLAPDAPREAGLLMAAAPSMLAALEECITDHGAHCIGNGDLIALGKRLLFINSVARAAISRARGTP